MEKHRLKHFIIHCCGWYVAVMSLFFFLFQIFVWSDYTSEWYEGEYCISVAAGQPYDFMIDSSPCRIDWMFFVNEPLFLSALAYLV
jgi:hypothetical protein